MMPGMDTLRQVWELLHKGSGYAAVVLAIATIFTGLKAIEPQASLAIVGLYALWVALTIVRY
jgi:hypothetical protein